MNSITIYPAQSLRGTLSIPGDKSISHRAIIFASLAEGVTQIYNLLESEDVLCTIDCFRAMGVSIAKEGDIWKVHGVGLRGLKPPPKILYCGNSGTTFRLLLGILAAQPFEAALTGDASLNRRPMKRVMDPLTLMGAQFRVEGEGTSHRVLHIKGGSLQGIHYKSPVASAQVKSAILLAGLWAKGETTVEEPSLSRDHTERMLKAFGVSLKRNQLAVSVVPPSSISLPSILKIPSDFSSAAFFLVAATLVPSSKITIKEVGLNPTRTGALDILKKMGAKILIHDSKVEGGEEVGTLEVSSSSLKGTLIEGEIIPRLIDEIPILSIAAAQAQGETIIRDAEELRVKETDRIKALVDLLGRLGVSAKDKPDGLIVQGLKGQLFKSTEVESFGDHRMAMSMAVAALISEKGLVIHDIDCVSTSFPTFWDCFRQLGGIMC
jgi:3-phosphoshikimate 1-carboxyvinyltransferase